MTEPHFQILDLYKDTTKARPEGTMLQMNGTRDGKHIVLLTIYADGRVEGLVEDANEAGRVFVESIRSQLHLIREAANP